MTRATGFPTSAHRNTLFPGAGMRGIAGIR
jgi:hypothetical protein